MPHPSTDRIADLAQRFDDLEPPAVRIARVRADVARRDLASLQRRGASARLLQAYRYRAEASARQLAQAWADALRGG